MSYVLAGVPVGPFLRKKLLLTVESLWVYADHLELVLEGLQLGRHRLVPHLLIHQVFPQFGQGLLVGHQGLVEGPVLLLQGLQVASLAVHLVEVGSQLLLLPGGGGQLGVEVVDHGVFHLAGLAQPVNLKSSGRMLKFTLMQIVQ